nr:MAG: capsid protein [Cressdnaviricota sp.]
MAYRYSYRNRAPGRRFGARGYRGGVRKRSYRRTGVGTRRRMVGYGVRGGGGDTVNIARRGYIGMGSRSEQKFKDIAWAVTAIDSTGGLTLLNGIQQGTTPSTRIGSVLNMRRIEVRLQATVTASTGIDQFQRFLLVYDRQTNGAALTGAQVLVNYDTTAPPLLENRDRFSILWDCNFHLNAAAESDSQKALYKTCVLNLPEVFIAGAGTVDTVADIKTGSLYLMYVGSVTAGATAGSFTGFSRIWYSDK